MKDNVLKWMKCQHFQACQGPETKLVNNDEAEILIWSLSSSSGLWDHLLWQSLNDAPRRRQVLIHFPEDKRLGLARRVPSSLNASQSEQHRPLSRKK